MDPLVIQLSICTAMGVVCAFLAHSRGRSPGAWFVIGFLFSCVALVILIAVPDLKKQEAKERQIREENRRLREQVRLQRETSDRRHAAIDSRLTAHDRALGVDTSERKEALLPSRSSSAPPRARAPAAPPAVETATHQWHFTNETGSQGPVTFDVLQTLWKSRKIDSQVFVWNSNMLDWKRIEDIPGLRERLDAGG